MKIDINNKTFHYQLLPDKKILISNSVMEQLSEEDMAFFNDWIMRCEGDPTKYKVKLSYVEDATKDKGHFEGVWVQRVGYYYGEPSVTLEYDKKAVYLKALDPSSFI